MRTIVLNSSNLIQDGQNNKLVYNFPSSVLFKDTYVAISSVSMYYSWFNIKASFGNNEISYSWTNTTNTVTYNLTIPDGLYEVSSLNQFLQFEAIKNSHYVIDSNGNNVYYFELVVNPARYAIQVNTFMVDDDEINNASITNRKYTRPPGWNDNTTSTTKFNPVITIPTQLGALLGYKNGVKTFDNTANPADISFITGTFDADGSTQFKPITNISKIQSLGTLSVVSNSAPNLQPNSSVLITCSSVDNPYANPSSVIYTISPNVGAGEIIIEQPPALLWQKLIGGTYNQIRIGFLGNDLNPLRILDPAMTVVLAFAEEKEAIG